MPFDPAISIPAGLFLSAWYWVRDRLMPAPVFNRTPIRGSWRLNSQMLQWSVEIGLKRGWFFWIRQIRNCRLYLIRQDWGEQGEPSGIWLKWLRDGVPVEDLSIDLKFGHSYQAVVVVRDENSGEAFIGNESFIDSDGVHRKYRLKAGRSFPVDDPVGRYSQWLEVRSGKKRWRSEHLYVVNVPPAGYDSNDQFGLDVVDL